MGMDVSFLQAFGAGLLSFLAPCVLPLVPGYLGYLGGASLHQMAQQDEIDPELARRVAWRALAFVLGLATVFILMGAGASTIGAFLRTNMTWISMVAGGIIVIFGLHFMGVFRIGFLYREARFQGPSTPAGNIGAYFLGLAFAFGWTPCVGPVLATILFIAAQSDSLWYGTGLLAVYAAGLGIPFLLAALFVKPFMRFMNRFKKHLHKIEIAIGLLLVLTGILIFFGELAEISAWLQNNLPTIGGK